MRTDSRSPRFVIRSEDSMRQVIALIRRLLREVDGQDLLEYGLLAALIAIFAMGAAATVGAKIYDVFWVKIGAAL